ncbi:MAG: ribosomal protein S18-alanine N-acetyltransferase [Lachnospiraceae bacterium]|nr:ribosomal protein S18-alanine N-acetyltransferase [Lachnospiraceae bacterium]
MKEQHKSEIQIRTMKAEDIAWAAQLEAELFGDAWTEAALMDTLRYRPETNFTAEADGVIVGYLLFMAAADEGELLRVGVSPKARRKGIASALMSHMESCAVSKGIATIWLEVRESNTAARALYEKTGFIEQGQRKKYYHDPVENAVIMSKVL